MAFDPHANLSFSLVATAPSPATSGTSLVVTATDGAIFPAVSFNALIWPTGVAPTRTNSEIIRVTVIATDTFTITRAQEGSVARSVVVGDQIAAVATSKTFTDIETALASPFAVAYGDLGSFTVATGVWAMLPHRVTLSSTGRITLAGTARLRLIA